jgi:RimJ/RimL family protein N-acetyltransferase
MTPGPSTVPNGTRRVALKAISDEDLAVIRTAELAWEVGYTWRHHGTHPSPDQFRAEFWSGVTAAFLVIDRARRAPIGVVTVYNADFMQQRAFCGCFAFAGAARPGLVLSGLVAVIRYCFWVWPLQKIYFEVPGFNLHQFEGSVGRMLHAEGSLENYWYLDGRWWPHSFYSLTRETAVELANGRFRSLLR